MLKYLLAIIAISTIGMWPFFKKGYFESQDGEWMVIRFSAFHQTLASGQFPVRFVDRLNNNYGYPVPNFLYPLPFYLAEVPKALGFNFTSSIKIIFVLSSVASSVLMFWALRQMFEKNAAFAGSIVYLFLPYRFVDLYIRGSLGESVAFLFLPAILGSIVKISQNKKIYIPVLAISTAALITSHNVIAFIFLPLFLALSVLYGKKTTIDTAIAFVLGLGTSAFFWIPALYDLQFVRLSQINVASPTEHLVDVSKLFMFGVDKAANVPTQLGIVSVAVFIATAVILFFKKSPGKIAAFFLLTYAVSVLLMLHVASPIWQNFQLAKLVQFPWRLLSVVVFSSAVLSAFVVNWLKAKSLATLALTTAAVAAALIYTKPSVFTQREDAYYSTNEDSTTVRDEYLPLWAKSKPQTRANEKIVVDKNVANIHSQTIKSANYKAKIESKEISQVTVNTVYFPGWQVKVDGKNVPLTQSQDYGLINFQLPQGTHEVIINYTRTPAHFASEVTSALAMLITGAYFFILWRKQNS